MPNATVSGDYALLGLPAEYIPPTPLRAGPLTLLFTDGDLRHIRFGDVEVVRRIYVAVRDQNWGTVPARLDDLRVETHDDSFAITYTARHRWPGIGFDWHGVITGHADGSLDFTLDGAATTSFLRNRIGFCILHPAAWRGKPCLVEHVDGQRRAGSFPDAISPHQPFFDLRAITQTLEHGAQVELRMEGDAFEMEDQRNWTDASYKTYSTPLRIPYPVQVGPGDRVNQAVRIRVHHAESAAVSPSTDTTSPITVALGRNRVAPLPAIGLGHATHGEATTPEQTRRLAACNLAHLRVDLDRARLDHAEQLHHATRTAQAINADLEIAVHMGDDTAADLRSLTALVEGVQPPVARWLVFAANQPVTPVEMIQAARAALAPLTPNAAIGGGTNLYFTHLNRNRPPADSFDCIAYSVNPQVHAFDNLSLVETHEAQPMTVTTARTFCGDTPLAITPITLRPRFNPDAAGPPAEPAPGQLPDDVDSRQPSLFAAAWTVGSLAALAPTGVTSLTYFETTGDRGVMQTERGTDHPGLFPAAAGTTYPLYHIFADLGPFAGGSVLDTTSPDPLRLAVLSLEREGRRRTLLANLTAQDRTVTLTGMSASAHALTLDASTYATASTAPDAFRGSSSALPPADSRSLTLAPYAVVRLDETL